MFCKYCGAEIEENSTYCPRCGKKLEEDTGYTSTFQDLGIEPNRRVKGKSKLAAALLAFFLGDIGIHHFYLGHTGAGILSIIFCWTGIPEIVAIVQGIFMLLESDEEFARRIKD